MGDLKRSELREEVEKNLGDRVETNDTPVQTRLNRHLHLAQIRIARAHPDGWRELNLSDEDTVTAAATYDDLPENLRQLYSLRRKEISSHSPKLTYIPSRQWDQLLGDPSTVSSSVDEVTHYTLWGGGDGFTVEWYPEPASDFDLIRRYSIWPADFAGDNDTSDLDHKDDVLIALATSTLFQSLGMREDAARWFFVYQDLFRQAKELDMTRPDSAIVPRGASDEQRLVRDPVSDPFVKRTV